MKQIKKEDFKKIYKKYQDILNDYRNGVLSLYNADEKIDELKEECRKNEIPFIPSKRTLHDIIPLEEEEDSYYEEESSYEEPEPEESFEESFE